MEKDRFSVRIAVYGIFEENNKILLQQRAGTNYKCGYYGVPSGHLENKESIKDALIREIKEETSVKIKEEYAELDYIYYGITNYPYMCLFFKILKYEGEFKIMEPQKCSDLRFFDKNNLPKDIVPELLSYFKDKKNNKFFCDKI